MIRKTVLIVICLVFTLSTTVSGAMACSDMEASNATMHLHADSLASNTVQVVQSLNDNSDNHDSSNLVDCEQCCHASCHIAMNNQTATYHVIASSKHFISSGETYLSQLNSPPFQPPRA